jgi:hypothetical protein
MVCSDLVSPSEHVCLNLVIESGVVAHTCNPSDSEGKGRKSLNSRPGKVTHRTCYKNKRAGIVAQVVECLLHVHEDLDSICSTTEGKIVFRTRETTCQNIKATFLNTSISNRTDEKLAPICLCLSPSHLWWS